MRFTIHGRLPSLNEVVGANRTNCYKGAQQKKAAQALIAPQLPTKPIPGRNHYRFTWHCPNTRRDPDNITVGVKFILDSMVAGGIIENDGWAQVASISHEFYTGDERVEVEITPCDTPR